MFTVEVKNSCRCFLRSGMIEKQRFSTLADAKSEAEKMVAQMKADFCKKHNFVLTQAGHHLTISILPVG